MGVSNIFFLPLPYYLTLILGTQHDKESSQNPMDFHCTDSSCMRIDILFHSKRLDRLYAAG